MITPESARLQSNENAWKRLSSYCKKGMQWAIDKGLTQVKLNYNNRNYIYFVKYTKYYDNLQQVILKTYILNLDLTLMRQGLAIPVVLLKTI